ncbi:hypothetical protein BU23DRAFT_503935 [Bimuria novae-zelandiae CBS 107.79]|uniref:Bromodomain associated domain-containing protein n=1 Tax=Bimuria novae-zelandiae CBS 107.79 TaxID=1447943 RepID=A0A6A5VHH8_9PLEO|nr:hypothetical protein BU23DRAFT_503935 [Bimuria novae-zelandiae CBS 107.79]
MSTSDVYNALLRPAVLDILRAAGFNGAKPSVVDTVVDLTARYLTVLASRTAYNAYSNHNDLDPDVTDVRMAMQDCGLLVPTLTAAEELWKEILRKPLEEYDDPAARAEEERRRDREDTQDVTAFIEWVTGKQNEEIMRIAGTLKKKDPTGASLTAQEERDKQEMEDYLTSLMKKHSKTGVDSRYQGTVVGKPVELRAVKIEGGAAESIEEWCRKTRERAAQAAQTAMTNSDTMDVDHEREDSQPMASEP